MQLIKNKFFSPEAEEELWSLAQFINEIFGRDKLTRLEQLVSGELESYGYNEVGVEKIGDNIIISCDVSGTPEVIIPIDKFAQLLEQLSSIADLRRQEVRPKEIIFKFDDDWNCEIEVIK